MTGSLKLREEPVTQEKFDRLPALLTRAQFQWVTGLSNQDLDAMRESGEIGKHKRRGGKYHKYFKTDAARIGNFTL